MVRKLFCTPSRRTCPRTAAQYLHHGVDRSPKRGRLRARTWTSTMHTLRMGNEMRRVQRAGGSGRAPAFASDHIVQIVWVDELVLVTQ